MVDLPVLNGLVEVSVGREYSYPSRVEDLDRGVYTVAAPIDAPKVPPLGAGMHLTWLHDGNRYAAPVRVVGFTKAQPPSWQLRLDGEARRETRRNFVRGGGGERLQLWWDGGSRCDGVIVNLSEGGVRCRLATAEAAPDDRVTVRLLLGDEVVEAAALVLSVRAVPDADQFEVVATYQLDEQRSQTVRRYVLQWQMLQRRRAQMLGD
jgi:hypothetical protein